MEWYYASNGQQQGPVSQEQLIELFKKGEVKTSDLVWNESMTDWVAFGNVPALNQSGAAPSGAVPSQVPPDQGPIPAAAGGAAAASTGTQVVGSSVPSAGGANIPNYLWQSIVCMVLCCLPLGIPALIFATKVKPAVEMGRLDDAREASKKAKMWCWYAFGVGLVIQILYVGCIGLGAMVDARAM